MLQTTTVRNLCQSHGAECVNHPRTCHLTKLATLISRIYIAVLLGVITIGKNFPPRFNGKLGYNLVWITAALWKIAQLLPWI